MRERVELLVGRATRAMWVMTFHSACARMLRADAHRLGYTRQFTIYDAADQRRLIKRCLDDLDIDAKRFTPRAMQSQISDAKNKLRSTEDYRQLVGSYFEQTVADVYEQYERELHRMNAMDFDDLLVRSRQPARALPGGPRPLRGRLPLDPRRRVPGHQPRPVPLAPAAGLRAPQRRGRRRRRPVPRRGDADHDGRRVGQADRGRSRPATRCCRPTAAATSGPARVTDVPTAPSGAGASGSRRAAAGGSSSHARAHALRRLPARATRRRCIIDLPHAAPRQGLPGRDDAPDQPAEGKSRSAVSRSRAMQERADAAWVDFDARHGGRGPAAGDAAVAAVTASRRCPSSRGRAPRAERRRGRPGADRRDLLERSTRSGAACALLRRRRAVASTIRTTIPRGFEGRRRNRRR